MAKFEMEFRQIQKVRTRRKRKFQIPKPTSDFLERISHPTFFFFNFQLVLFFYFSIDLSTMMTDTAKGDFKDKQFAETEVADKVVEQCRFLCMNFDACVQCTLYIIVFCFVCLFDF